MSQSSDSTRAELPIDWRQLRQLSDGNEEFELELLNIFLTETTSRLQQAQQAILHSQAAVLGHIAHQIKGSSGNIGMGEMVRLARRLEQTAQTENWEDAANTLEALARSLNFIQNFLQS